MDFGIVTDGQFQKHNAPSLSVLREHADLILDGKISHSMLLNAVANWRMSGAPYVNLYPVAFHALLKTDMDVDIGSIPKNVLSGFDWVEIRIHKQCDSMTPFLMQVGRSDESTTLGKKTMIALFGSQTGDTLHVGAQEGKRINSDLSGLFVGGMKGRALEIHRMVLKTALGIMLLASDPDYCKRVILADDEGKTLTSEQRLKAEEKAIRRGKIGFDIGRNIEVSPHFRRPHFAIRWTGKGGSVPKLTLVKGSVINAGLLAEVPTGYEGDGDL